MKIKEKLQEEQEELTYYQYQIEFSKFLAPFGARAGDFTYIHGMNFIKFQGLGFEMQETEVTRGQWKAVMDSYPEDNNGECGLTVLSNDHPVSCVSAKDAELFANKMSEIDGREYRLPSEDEWVEAGGVITGVDDISEYGWCEGGVKPVKKLKAYNGLYDMVGNLGEWTSSDHEDYNIYWKETRILGRVIRGRGIPKRKGKFHCHGTRSVMRADKRASDVGFRLLRVL